MVPSLQDIGKWVPSLQEYRKMAPSLEKDTCGISRENGMNKKRIWMKQLCLYLLCAAMVLVSGCADKNVYVTSFDKKYLFSLGEHDVTTTEYKLILLEVQKKYQEYYGEILGEDFWQQKTEDGSTFEEYVKEHIVLDELVSLEALQILAEELNITLIEDEQEEAKCTAKAYMETAGEAAISYCGSTEELVQQLIEKYLVAGKVISYYTEQADLEVSENEARAIRIQVLNLESAEIGEQVTAALAEGSSFQNITERFGNTEPIEYNVVRGELLEEIEEVAFALGKDACSPVLKTEKGYCVIYCMNDYLTDLTESNRQNIIRQRIYDVWFSKVEEVRKEVKLTMNASEWDKIQMAEDDAVESCFFQIYETYFGDTALGSFAEEN